jgi:UDP-glucose 4-epimerase
MRIVIVGASGNIGTALLQALDGEERDLEIVALARREPTSFDSGQVDWRAVDVSEDPLAEHLEGADVVVHLAWLFHPSHHPQATWKANVGGAARVMDAVERARVPALVCSSSVAAYSPRRDASPVDESWPTHGASDAPYVREKSYVERLLDTFEARNPDRRVVRMRPAFVFHPRAAIQQRRLFMGPLAPRQLVDPRFLPLLPLPRGLLLQTIHADDVAEAFASAVVGDAHGAFNVCADDVIEPPDLAEAFDARLVTLPAGWFGGALRTAWWAHLVPAHPSLFDCLMQLPVMSNQRARRELGWAPKATALQAIGEFVAGLRDGAGHPTPPLAPATSGRLRRHEFAAGVGEHD